MKSLKINKEYTKKEYGGIVELDGLVRVYGFRGCFSTQYNDGATTMLLFSIFLHLLLDILNERVVVGKH